MDVGCVILQKELDTYDKSGTFFYVLEIESDENFIDTDISLKCRRAVNGHVYLTCRQVSEDTAAFLLTWNKLGSIGDIDIVDSNSFILSTANSGGSDLMLGYARYYNIGEIIKIMPSTRYY